jgi:N-formylglutamate amidohydrolase
MPRDPRFVVCIPHSGIYFPCDFPRRFTRDRFKVDECDIGTEGIYDLTKVGGIVIKSRVHRNTLDLNRVPEFDINFKKHNPKTGQDKWFGKDLTETEKKYLLKRYYDPFYNEAEEWMKYLKTRHKRAFLLNAHTFNLGIGKFSICVGDGGVCSSDFKYAFIKFLERFFKEERDLDYQGIGLDYPFDGTDGPSRRFGKPENGYDALLIEFNRELFIDSRKNQELLVGPQMKEVIPWKILRVNGCLVKAIDCTLKEVYGI